MKNRWQTVLKGLIVGSTMIIPGVSGGSMAMILGIYDRLISAVSSFRKNIKENLLFLVLFAFCAAVGMFLFSAPLSWLLEHYEMPVMYFFLGTVFGGIPLIEKKSQIQKVTWESLLYMLIGAGIILGFSRIPEDILEINSESGFAGKVLLFFSGLLSAAALVLPGISVSHFLLILGLYEEVLNAIQTINISFFAALGLGALLGVLLLTKILDYVMTKYPKQSYLMILGFIFASVGEIFPGIPEGFNIVICLGLFASGFWAIYQITKRE